jgi:hypothetical protein
MSKVSQTLVELVRVLNEKRLKDGEAPDFGDALTAALAARTTREDATALLDDTTLVQLASGITVRQLLEILKMMAE